MKKILGTTAMAATLVLTSSALVRAATLCARSASPSAAVVTPASGTSCRPNEIPIQTEPPAVTARQAPGITNFVNGTVGLGSLTTPVFVTVKEAGVYVVVASGVFHNPDASDSVVVQCRLRKRTAAGQIFDSLSNSLTVQYIRQYTWDPVATTATGYFFAGEGAELVCQSYAEHPPWGYIGALVKDLKVTAVKVSSVSETVINQAPPPVIK